MTAENTAPFPKRFVEKTVRKIDKDERDRPETLWPCAIYHQGMKRQKEERKELDAPNPSPNSFNDFIYLRALLPLDLDTLDPDPFGLVPAAAAAARLSSITN